MHIINTKRQQHKSEERVTASTVNHCIFPTSLLCKKKKRAQKSHNGGDQRKYAIINFSHFTPLKCAHNMAKRKAVQTLHKKVLLCGTMGEDGPFPGVYVCIFPDISRILLSNARNVKSAKLLQIRRIMTARGAKC